MMRYRQCLCHNFPSKLPSRLHLGCHWGRSLGPLQQTDNQNGDASLKYVKP
jgi:hypothetical protein